MGWRMNSSLTNKVIDNYIQYFDGLTRVEFSKIDSIYRVSWLAKPTFPNGCWFGISEACALSYKYFGAQSEQAKSLTPYLYKCNPKFKLKLLKFKGGHMVKFASFYESPPNHFTINLDLIKSLSELDTELDGIYFEKDEPSNCEFFISKPDKTLNLLEYKVV